MEYVQVEKWLSSNMGVEMVMMSIDTGNYLSISRVGVRIYELLKKPATLDAICERLLEEYKVEPEVCRAEVESFIQQMIEHGAIRQVSQRPTR